MNIGLSEAIVVLLILLLPLLTVAVIYFGITAGSKDPKPPGSAPGGPPTG